MPSSLPVPGVAGPFLQLCLSQASWRSGARGLVDVAGILTLATFSVSFLYTRYTNLRARWCETAVMDYFCGKSILITGATSGIGFELAKLLAAPGPRAAKHVFLHGRSHDKLDDVVRAIEHENAGILSTTFPMPQITQVVADFARPDEVREAFQRVIGDAHDCELDIVFCNAGVSQRDEFVCMASDPEALDALLATNLGSQISMLAAIIGKLVGITTTKEKVGNGVESKHLAAARKHIVYTSSFVGRIAFGFRSIYAAAKFGGNGFFTSLQAELWDKNVRITKVYPGFVATNIARNAIVGSATTSPVTSPKKKPPVIKRGESDGKIDAGLQARAVAKRMLAACKFEEGEVEIFNTFAMEFQTAFAAVCGWAHRRFALQYYREQLKLCRHKE